MALELKSQYDGDKKLWVVDVIGEIDIYTASKLKETLAGMLNEYNSDVKINCKQLDYIDSTGLGVLIGALKRLKQENKNIIIKSPRKNILKLLSITGLDKIFIVEGE